MPCSSVSAANWNGGYGGRNAQTDSLDEAGKKQRVLAMFERRRTSHASVRLSNKLLKLLARVTG